MIDLFEAALELQTFCDRHQWRSCFIGGVAVLRWGDPRVTRDVDLTLLTGFGDLASFIDPLLAAFPARIENAREFAERNRILLLKTSNAIGIDISLGALPYEERLIDRSSTFAFDPDRVIRTCSAEDLIVMKVFAARPLDLRDAESVVLRGKTSLSWDVVAQEIQALAEVMERPEMLNELARLRALG